VGFGGRRVQVDGRLEGRLGRRVGVGPTAIRGFRSVAISSKSIPVPIPEASKPHRPEPKAPNLRHSPSQRRRWPLPARPRRLPRSLQPLRLGSQAVLVIIVRAHRRQIILLLVRTIRLGLDVEIARSTRLLSTRPCPQRRDAAGRWMSGRRRGKEAGLFPGGGEGAVKGGLGSRFVEGVGEEVVIGENVLRRGGSRWVREVDYF
jgi:hypothetical protein